MNQLMQLRKCCNHPYLFADSDETDENMVEMSGKLKLLDILMKEFFQKNHKVLIFSQFTSMLDIIQDYFWLRKWSSKICRIDGSVKMEERQEQINAFNDETSEKSVFLLSTRAGGVGINLASADTVIIFDSDWNPHMDTQAQDRAHRIGQKKNVIVYRLCMEGSVELKILERANAKRSLERLAMAGNFGAKKQKKETRKEVIKSLASEVVNDLLSKDINIRCACVCPTFFCCFPSRSWITQSKNISLPQHVSKSHINLNFFWLGDFFVLFLFLFFFFNFFSFLFCCCCCCS